MSEQLRSMRALDIARPSISLAARRFQNEMDYEN